MQSGYRQNQTPPAAAPVAQIAARVRSGEWRATDVLADHIACIARVNPVINAVVCERFEDAKREARRIDADPGALPLAGVPFTVKEMIEVAGMPLTFGCVARADWRGARDATVVARLRAAGAVPIGVTNVPEWGMWPETTNHVYGRTANPWDLRRTAGGSSGGEGAGVAAGCAAFGIGSDIGGSVRIPAAFCGVFGHKPTNGLLPLTGHHPVYAEGSDRDLARRAPYVTIGPLARFAMDLMPLLRVMAGPDDIDPNVERIELGDDEAVDWRGRRVVLLPAPDIGLARRARSVQRDVVLRAGEHLAAFGAELDTGPVRTFRRAADAWFGALQSVGGPSFGELLGAGEPVHPFREVAAGLLGRSRFSWPALLFLAGERIGRRTDRGLYRALAELDRMTDRFTTLVGDDAVLILPAYPSVAPRHGTVVLHPFDFLYAAVFNALRAPVTVAPAGTDRHGMPVAVQIAARRGGDHLTIAAARALEIAGMRWTPAPVLQSASDHAAPRIARATGQRQSGTGA